MHKQETYSGQILLITVLVLMIVSIVVVGVVSLANRDVQQVASEQQYQEILNESELQVLDFVSKYGAANDAYTQIINQEPQCIAISTTNYECNLGVTPEGIENEITIEDLDYLQDYELTKDANFDVYLGRFRGEIQFNYTGVAALEFQLFYIDAGGDYQVITDVFDVTGGQVYDILIGDPLDNSSPNHPFNFRLDPSSGNYAFTINDIDGFTSVDLPVSLNITARIPSDGVTLLDLEANNGGLSPSVAGVFPDQVRKYSASSYFAGGEANIATTVDTQVPLLPQGASFLYNGLLAEGLVEK